MKYRNISWDELNDHVEKLAEDIKSKNKGKIITGVFGLPRGGLVPAVMLSHKLNVPLLLAPCENWVVRGSCSRGKRLFQHYKKHSNHLARLNAIKYTNTIKVLIRVPQMRHFFAKFRNFQKS
jgi:hypoxanthine phosphoribosyltransferase